MGLLSCYYRHYLKYASFLGLQFWEESNTVELRVTGVGLSSQALTEETA